MDAGVTSPFPDLQGLGLSGSVTSHHGTRVSQWSMDDEFDGSGLGVDTKYLFCSYDHCIDQSRSLCEDTLAQAAGVRSGLGARASEIGSGLGRAQDVVDQLQVGLEVVLILVKNLTQLAVNERFFKGLFALDNANLALRELIKPSINTSMFNDACSDIALRYENARRILTSCLDSEKTDVDVSLSLLTSGATSPVPPSIEAKRLDFGLDSVSGIRELLSRNQSQSQSQSQRARLDGKHPVNLKSDIFGFGDDWEVVKAVAGQLSIIHHPACCEVYGVIEEEGVDNVEPGGGAPLHVVVQADMPSATLREVLNARASGALPLVASLYIALQLAGLLVYFEAGAGSHTASASASANSSWPLDKSLPGCLAPESILVDGSNRVKVDVIGTYNRTVVDGIDESPYIAPECIAGPSYRSHAASVYSLGQILSEMVSGSVETVVDSQQTPAALGHVIRLCLISKEKRLSAAALHSSLLSMYTSLCGPFSILKELSAPTMVDRSTQTASSILSSRVRFNSSSPEPVPLSQQMQQQLQLAMQQEKAKAKAKAMATGKSISKSRSGDSRHKADPAADDGVLVPYTFGPFGISMAVESRDQERKQGQKSGQQMSRRKTIGGSRSKSMPHLFAGIDGGIDINGNGTESETAASTATAAATTAASAALRPVTVNGGTAVHVRALVANGDCISEIDLGKCVDYQYDGLYFSKPAEQDAVDEKVSISITPSNRTVNCMAVYPRFKVVGADGEASSDSHSHSQAMLMVALGGAGEVSIWDPHPDIDEADLDSNPETHLVAELHGHTGSIWCIESFLYENAWYLISGGEDGTLLVWSVESMSSTAVLAAHEASVYCVAVYSDGKKAVSGGGDGIVIWNVVSGNALDSVQVSSPVSAVAVFGKEAIAYTGHWDGQILFWDLETTELIARLPGHGAEVASLAIFHGGQKMLSGGRDDQIRMWNLANCTTTFVFKLKHSPGLVKGLSTYDSDRKFASVVCMPPIDSDDRDLDDSIESDDRHRHPGDGEYAHGHAAIQTWTLVDENEGGIMSRLFSRRGPHLLRNETGGLKLDRPIAMRLIRVPVE